MSKPNIPESSVISEPSESFGNILSQLLTLGSMGQVNGRMIVRRMPDGAELILIYGQTCGPSQRHEWVILPPDMRWSHVAMIAFGDMQPASLTAG